MRSSASRSRWRVSDLIEELGRREDFDFDLVGGSSRGIAGPVLDDAHFADKLPRANRAEQDGVSIEFPEYVDGTAEYAKNTVRRVSLSEEDLPFGEVRAGHYSPFYAIAALLDGSRPASVLALSISLG